MRRLRFAFWGSLFFLLVVWWLGDPLARTMPSGWIGWRQLAVQATGVVAIGSMSIAMVLAARPRVLEPWLDGLDKMYRLHKWLGIAALVASVVHWVAAKSPKWMVALGWMEPRTRGPRPSVEASALRELIGAQRDRAESLGEVAFLALVALIVLALVRRFPYRLFFRTHRLLVIVWLALAFHTVVLLRWTSWPTVLGVVMGGLLVAGTLAAVAVVVRRVSHDREVVATVSRVIPHEALDVVELVLEMKGRWPGHEAGQFAFLSFDDREGPHPFTITSAWKGDGRVEFVIKALGDWTRSLVSTVRPGDVVRVEGPWGRFNFEGSSGRQIWIGAGIGVTPFIARMKSLAEAPDGRSIDLFHPTATLDPEAISLLERDAAAAGVRLHVLWDERDGLLDASRLMEAVPEWQSADVWFCGPAGFGLSLRRALEREGLPPERFHQELFEMR